jgi:adenine phosphoribosyltransferase
MMVRAGLDWRLLSHVLPEIHMIFDEFSIKSLIRPVVDFPKPGVIFRDITPLFQSPKALRLVIDSFIQRYIDAEFTHVGAMDARGFLIGSIVAYELNKPLVLFRKQGKLPADVLAEAYQTEYGEALLEVHADSLCDGDSVVMFDDLIATGGTLVAAANLIRRMGAKVHEAAAIIDLPELGGSKRLRDMEIPTFCLTEFALTDK